MTENDYLVGKDEDETRKAKILFNDDSQKITHYRKYLKMKPFRKLMEGEEKIPSQSSVWYDEEYDIQP